MIDVSNQLHSQMVVQQELLNDNMKHKRLKHFTDIFCRWFFSYRYGNDDDMTLHAYKNGDIKLDILNEKIYFNENEINISLNIFDDIIGWFISNIEKEKIDINYILEAFIIINNKSEEIVYKYDREVAVDFKVMAKIKTDEREYISEIHDKYKVSLPIYINEIQEPDSTGTPSYLLLLKAMFLFSIFVLFKNCQGIKI